MTMIRQILILTLLMLFLAGCQKRNETSVAATEPDFSFLQNCQVMNTPAIESTGFDSEIVGDPLSQGQIKLLKLQTIATGDSIFYLKYKLNFDSRYTTLVFSHYPNEAEVSTLLVNYDENFNIISYLPIAYDEIAEGLIRTKSKIEGNIITVIRFEFNSDQPDSTIASYQLLENGHLKNLLESTE